ncbi:MAG TPA: hypothetical protein VK463_04475 [Desulfomonilaceae bacterium]|nr:hypothetical protein [Desulfomonilaceae bacterium]
MKYGTNGSGGRAIVCVVALAALCFFCVTAMTAHAQQPASPSKQQPGAQEKAKSQVPAKAAQPQPVEQAAGTDQKGDDYAACSPVFPGEQIAEMMNFVAVLSADLPGKLRPIVLKCDFAVNSQILGFLENLQEEIADAEFQNEDQEKNFLAEKAKEVEIQLALVQKPVNESEIKKLVGDIFEFRQKSMRNHAADLEKEAADLKKRVEEREKLKDQIVEKKAKEISAEAPQTAGAGPSADDKLSWD